MKPNDRAISLPVPDGWGAAIKRLQPEMHLELHNFTSFTTGFSPINIKRLRVN